MDRANWRGNMTIKARGRPRKTENLKQIPVAVKEKAQNNKNKKMKVEQEGAILPVQTQAAIVRTVLDRLDGKSVILHGIDRTRTDLMSNLKCAVNDNRGNSSILIGPRASGKTTLIKQLITETVANNDSTHTIETLTLQGAIFSETQSVLKYLLNKLKTIVSGQSVIEDHQSEDLNDLSEYLAFDQLSALVKQYLTAKSTKKRYIIFVLEDLEKFAAHPQQNLLYCLFELALALPVFVFGTSCRIDVLELLEKRVKSRFSQNIVYLPLPMTLDSFIDRIKVNLMIDSNRLPDSSVYNTKMEEFITSNQMFRGICEFNFDFTKDVRPVFRGLTLAFSAINNESFDWNTFPALFESVNGPKRPEIPLIPSVMETTVVELMILVAMCRLAAKFPSTPVTFEVMAEELAGCKKRAPGLEHFRWPPSTIQVAFDRLLNARLLLQTSNASVSASNSSWLDRSYLTVRLGLPNFVILDAIERHSFNSKEIFALACEKF